MDPEASQARQPSIKVSFQFSEPCVRERAIKTDTWDSPLAYACTDNRLTSMDRTHMQGHSPDSTKVKKIKARRKGLAGWALISVFPRQGLLLE